MRGQEFRAVAAQVGAPHFKLGAAGYLNKSADAEQMTEAIRRVAGGRLFITPNVAEQLAGAVGGGTHDDTPLHERLSHREYQVFRLLAAGRSVGEIAEQLHVSPKTVATHRENVLHKLQLRGVAELTRYALREGLSSLDATPRTSLNR